MTEQEMKDRIHELAPFHHDVKLPFSLSTHVPELARRPLERTRLSNLVKHAWPSLLRACGGTLQGQRVLDFACNCGGFSVEAARGGAEYVLGIDIVDRYIEQARFIKDALGLDNLEFRKASIEDLDEESVGRFDITFCFGILYHLGDPVTVMRRLSSFTRRIMVVDTTVRRTPFVRAPVWQIDFRPPSNPECRSATTSLWRQSEGICQFIPNTHAVVELLKFLGFSRITRLRPKEKGLEKRYYKGKRVTFLATRD